MNQIPPGNLGPLQFPDPENIASQKNSPSTARRRLLIVDDHPVIRAGGRGYIMKQAGPDKIIAASLHLSIKTVDTHRATIRRKLGLKSNTELIHRAIQWIGTQA